MNYHAIYSGTPWFDNNGNIVSAHGACIIKGGGKYYLFGEKHSDTAKAFTGFNCYSSSDLYNWKFESLALPVQKEGQAGPNRIGERVKVMKCPSTGEYVMYWHADNLQYKDPHICYATSDNITGPYTYQGVLLFRGHSIHKWDMGTFQDKDGSGYILTHGGDIYKLSKDYKRVVDKWENENIVSRFESPAMFRKDSIYFFLGSHLTSWERNDNFYYTATSLKGPWTYRGNFAPKGTLTWNSQTTFVLPVKGSKDTSYMFMGDRWSYPKQASAATYVWQPLTVSGDAISIPQYKEGWKISLSSGVIQNISFSGREIIPSKEDKDRITYSGEWRNDTLSVFSSDEKGATFSLKFEGKKIGIYGLSRPDGGYAKVVLQKENGKQVFSSIVDMYCKYPIVELKFLSPDMPSGHYTLIVSVMGTHGNWSDKSKTKFGSIGNYVSLNKIVVR